MPRQQPTLAESCSCYEEIVGPQVKQLRGHRDCKNGWDKKKHAAIVNGLYKLVILRYPDMEKNLGGSNAEENTTSFGKHFTTQISSSSLIKRDHVVAFLVGLEKTKVAFENSPGYPLGLGFNDPRVPVTLYEQGREWFYKRSWTTEEGSSRIISKTEIKERYNIELGEEAVEIFQTRAPFNQHFSAILACLAGGVADNDDDVQLGLELLCPNEGEERLPKKRQRSFSPPVVAFPAQ